MSTPTGETPTPAGADAEGDEPIEPSSPSAANFIEALIAKDVAAGKHGGRVVTRFPPEPNGYLHIGHAKSICLNFGLAKRFGGRCHLRMDDTNPLKESEEYVRAICDDLRWLGFEWDGPLRYASDYFGELYEMALVLIDKELAYVCDLDGDAIRAHRGTLTSPGRDSPWRTRSRTENRDLFERMRAGEFPDGSRTLRAKIDMASPNITLRDPVLYRILRATHHRSGDTWCIYPTYDFAHGQSDALEGITHSICTLEFENHRPLYDWLLAAIGLEHRPVQIEFARLAMTYTVMSKRKLLLLVQGGTTSGWDDPRMPTISGLRRRGYTSSAIRTFAERIGVARMNSTVDVAVLEDCIRDDLNASAPRRFGILDPLPVTIDNWPAEKRDTLVAANHPQDPSFGTRELGFGRELYIERDDFMEDPPKKFFRLAPGREVRLRYGYFLRCDGVEKDAAGKVIRLRCSVDPATRGGSSPDGRKVKGTIHWLDAATAIPTQIRLYDALSRLADPEDVPAGQDWMACLNPHSLVVVEGLVEPAFATAAAASRWQLERHGYFCVDPDSAKGRLVLNRTVGLRDQWAKISAQAQG